jgi:hypothetical protein
MQLHKNESLVGIAGCHAASASSIRIVVFRLRHHVRNQPQGAERCDGRDIEDDPHGRPPLRKPAVQVSRQELLAVRVLELGLFPAVAGKSFDCDFPASLAAALQTFAIASGSNGFVARDRYRARWVFPPSEPQCSSRKGARPTQATNRWTPQCSMDGFIPRQKGRLQQLVIIQALNLGVAEFGEPRRHRAVKLLQRSACTAPPLSWN